MPEQQPEQRISLTEYQAVVFGLEVKHRIQIETLQRAFASASDAQKEAYNALADEQQQVLKKHHELYKQIAKLKKRLRAKNKSSKKRFVKVEKSVGS